MTPCHAAIMSKVLPIIAFISLFCVACTDTTGLSAETSREPHGNPNGVVTVVEFSDLQCPACRGVHLGIVPPIVEEFAASVRFEFRHFPLSYHEHALSAAMAVECAADQGKFWEYIDIAFTNQADLSEGALKTWALSLGLDTNLFTRCLESEIKKDIVLADYSAGREVGVPGTPSFFIDGEKVSTGELRDAIASAIAKRIQKL